VEPEFTPQARAILEQRYLLRDEQGKVVETPEQMLWRVARHVAQAKNRYGKSPCRWAERFYCAMARLEFLPNSPCLMNAGTRLGNLCACFVLLILDSLKAIFSTLKKAVTVWQTGGGTGFDFSRLRPKNDIVMSTGGVASGPVSFIRVYDAAAREINQGGRRRGANMAVLRSDHPDILEFITAKSEPGILECFNLSVSVTNDFMQKAIAGKDYDTINPRTGKPVGRLNAAEVLALIAKQAHSTGDPGVIFLDTINSANPTPEIGQIEATNPCGEAVLLNWESCILGSINLVSIVQERSIDWSKLRETVRLAVRFLDNVIDVNKYPLPEIERMTKGNRKTGLGVMGFADMLYKLGIPYDSQEALNLAEQIMRKISETAREESEKLAIEKRPFPNFQKSVYHKHGARALRNATRTTIAPTGTISLIAGVSSGIEPNFSLVYRRRIGNERVIITNPVFEQVAKERGFFSPELLEEILAKGSIKDIKGIPDDVKRLFVTALEIPPEWHVRMQAAFQKHTDNAVSKTVNLPRNSTVEDVKNIFLMAWKLGCKGITVYRDGSRADQVLTTGARLAIAVQPRQRPEKTQGITKKVRVGCGNLYITVNKDREGLCEVFTNVGRGGGCPAQAEATSRLSSIALRAGVTPEAIVEQLRGIRCMSTIVGKNKHGFDVLSCPDAIGRTIEEFLKGAEVVTEELFHEHCPECGSELEHEGGRCVICRSCGFSRCF
jgi:ribonucleoside-diphosphate reductase alpha chain